MKRDPFTAFFRREVHYAPAGQDPWCDILIMAHQQQKAHPDAIRSYPKSVRLTTDVRKVTCQDCLKELKRVVHNSLIVSGDFR